MARTAKWFAITETVSIYRGVRRILYTAQSHLQKTWPTRRKEDFTFFLDGFSYLSQLKWTAICEAKGIDPSAKEQADKREADQRDVRCFR